MDYQQFKKFMEKVDKIESLVEKVANIEQVIVKLANHIENGLEEANGALLRIESIIETYVERSLKDTES